MKNLLIACKKLKTLALFHPGKDFTGVGLAVLAELPALDSLTVGGSMQFADEGIAAVAKLKGLRGFRTWHTGVTLDGVKELAAFENLTSLTPGQRLSYTPPTTLADDWLPVLAQFKKLPKLKRLTLDGVEISESDIAALKQQLPDVDVRRTEPSEIFRKRIDALYGPAK